MKDGDMGNLISKLIHLGQLEMSPPEGYEQGSERTAVRKFFFNSVSKAGPSSGTPGREHSQTLMCRVTSCGRTVNYNGNIAQARRHVEVHLVEDRDGSLVAKVNLPRHLLQRLALFGDAHLIPPGTWDDPLFSHFLSGYRSFSSNLHASVDVEAPSRYQVASRLDEAYLYMKSLIAGMFENSECCSIMIDGWDHMDEHFMGIVGCFIAFRNGAPLRKSLLIGMPSYDPSMTRGAEQSAELLDRTLLDLDYRSSSRIPPVILSDAASVNAATVRESKVLGTPVVLIPCAAHMIGNCAKYAVRFVPAVLNLVQKIRGFVSLVSQHDRLANAVRERDYLDRKARNERAKMRNYATATEVRWSSTYKMLKRFLDLVPSLRVSLENDVCSIFTTPTGRKRKSDDARFKMFGGLLEYLRDDGERKLLEDVVSVLSNVDQVQVVIQLRSVSLSFVKIAVARLYRQMGSVVAAALGGSLPDILSCEILCDIKSCSPAVALAAAVRFQIAHRFYSTLIHEDRAHVCVSNDDPSSSHASRPLKRARGRVSAPMNEHVGQNLFAASSPAVEATFPLPVLPHGFDVARASSRDWASLVFVLSVYFDLRCTLPFSGEQLPVVRRILDELVQPLDEQGSSEEDESTGSSATGEVDTSLVDVALRCADTSVAQDMRYLEQIRGVSANDSLTLLKMDPIALLAGHQKMLPRLFNLAVTILGIPAGSVDVERVFSSGRVCQKFNQYSMEPTTFRRKMMLSCNMDELREEMMRWENLSL